MFLFRNSLPNRVGRAIAFHALSGRLALVAFTFLLAASAHAQVNSFPRPGYFRETFSQPVTRVDLAPPVRLQDFVVSGKDGKMLELSLKDYLSLVMSNNTDVAIQRLTISTAENSVMRSFSIFDP